MFAHSDEVWTGFYRPLDRFWTSGWPTDDVVPLTDLHLFWPNVVFPVDGFMVCSPW